MLDLSLAAHVLPLINAPLPDTLLSSFLCSSYPTLISHARRVLGAAMPTTRVLPPERYKLSALLPYPSFRAWWNEPHRAKSEEEKRFERMRWRWIGLAIAGSLGYWFIWGPELRLVKVADGYGEERLGIIVGGDSVVLDDDDEEEEDEGNGGGNE
jgi:sorting and assembly machinery component 37